MLDEIPRLKITGCKLLVSQKPNDKVYNNFRGNSRYAHLNLHDCQVRRVLMM